jgi:DNA (cytosine-5)-methyltransferase 1
VNDVETWVEGGVSPTLNQMDNSGESFATVLIIDGTRVGDVRVYSDHLAPTVISRYGTGGGNVPMIFSHTQGLDVQASEENSPTLRAGGDGMAVAYSVREDAKANTFSATETDTALALQALQPGVQSHHAQLFIAGSIEGEEEVEVMPTLLAGMSHLTGTTQDGYIEKVNKMISVVRRLTPTECERLQGFPDGWTEGQADSSRYKQMGNAVAVPVVSWIIERMEEK